jgi:MraZ protein|tara:strand:- start:1732 stop:2112 length:381 start_codon:yes stop_codon:yes gene_type:complete
MKNKQKHLFIIKRAVFQTCLELYPIEEWNKLMEKLNNLNRFIKKNNDFIRRFSAGVQMVELDAAERLLVPKNLADFAKIKKDIVLSSAINIIEIWDKELYEIAIDEATLDFSNLVEDVMGDSKDVS